MARRETNRDDEKRSYSGLFLLCVGLLLFGALWSVWDDNISRRPWKYHQVQFSQLQQAQVHEEMRRDEERLAKDPAYQAVIADLAAARQRLQTGEAATRIAALQTQRAGVKRDHDDVDLRLRIVKSQLEEVWYDYEHAILEQWPTEPIRARMDALDERRKALQQRFDDTKGEMHRIDEEIGEFQSEVRGLENKLRKFHGERELLEQRLEALTIPVGPLTFPKIPKIHQVELTDFERNNFDKPVSRVERCESCHAGIDKAGFDDAPQPYRTHPQRELILGKHPPDQFGCTPCHQGQGAAVNSPEQAHGEVRFWTEPLMRGDKVQASCIKCHANVGHLKSAEVIARGLKLFEELGCHGCHLVEGYEDLDKVGPYLRRVSAKLEPGWLVRWLTNPHDYRPKTRMPNFLFTAAQAEAIGAYLLDVTRADSEEWLASRPLPAGIDPRDPVLVARGAALADSVGCRGCHGFADGESPALLGENKDIAPNLGQIAEKTDARWLFYWLKGPRDYSPVSRMPSLRLTDEEARALASYLLTLGARQPVAADLAARLRDPDTIAFGKRLVRTYGCAGCHDIPGMENESRIGVELSTFGSKPIEELYFGNHTDIPHTWDDWTFNKLKDPRTYATERIEQVMPQFDLAEADINALRIFLASRTELKYPEHFHASADIRGQREVIGRRLVARYNCVGCHVIEGEGGAIRARYDDSPTMAPPVLNGQGAKVQADWFFGFLKQPTPIRPWLAVRMPTFGFSDREAAALVEYFAALDHIQVPFVHIDDTQLSPEFVEAGEQLASRDYFDCFSCHQQGDRKPEGPPEGWAPDLTMARQRLNPEWILRWLENPQAVQPGTKMPSFYEQGAGGEPTGGPDDIFDGDNAKQIRALRDYLLALGRADGQRVMRPETNGSNGTADAVAAVEDGGGDETEEAN